MSGKLSRLVQNKHYQVKTQYFDNTSHVLTQEIRFKPKKMKFSFSKLSLYLYKFYTVDFCMNEIRD